MFANRVLMDRDTPSPEPLVYLFIYLFIHSFIHSLIHVCLPESPKRSPRTYGEKRSHRSRSPTQMEGLYTMEGAVWFPKGMELVLLYVIKLATVGLLLKSVITFNTIITL